jgi:predicted dehydrogenase
MVFCVVAAAEAAEPAKKTIRVGIIGCDTSHCVAFAQVLNDPKASGDLAGVKIVAAYPGGSPDLPDSWNRVPEYTKQLRTAGVEIVWTIDALLEKVDAVLLESVDGRPHLEQAKPVFRSKKPVFIDKPMAGSLADALTIFRLAEESKTPVFSASSLRYVQEYQALRSGVSPLGKPRKCVAFGPYHAEPHHPDLFWYGIHGVESLYTVMGPGCKTVERTAEDRVVGHWADGREGVYQGSNDYAVEVVGDQGSGKVGKFLGYGPLVVEICKFFKTGKSPISPDETIELFAFMEGADQSKKLGGKPVSIESVLQNARAAAAKK